MSTSCSWVLGETQRLTSVKTVRRSMRRCAFTPCFVLFWFWFPPAGCQTALFEKTTRKGTKKEVQILYGSSVSSWLNLFYKLLFVTFLSEFPCVGLYPGHIWAGVKKAYRRNVFHQLFGVVAVNVDGQSTTRGRNLQFYLPKWCFKISSKFLFSLQHMGMKMPARATEALWPAVFEVLHSKGSCFSSTVLCWT